MASPDVVASALLLIIPLVSLPLSVYNWLVHRSTPMAATAFLLAILAAVSATTALSVACGEPLRVVAKVFATLLHTTLSSISVCVLGLVSLPPAFSSAFFRFLLSLAGFLVACELVSALIPTSPPLLPAVLALVSRGVLLTLAIATVSLRRRHATIPGKMHRAASESSGKTPGRVSSPTQATWPFPGSLAMQGQVKPGCCPTGKSFPSDLPSSAFPRTHGVGQHVYQTGTQNLFFVPLILAMTQIFAILSAALNVAASILVGGTISRTQSHILLLASATCTLLWSLTILATIQMLSVALGPYSPKGPVVIDCERKSPGDDIARFSRDHPLTRTPKPCLSRRESDSLLDFLSLRDPFASSPPPPPPLPPVGLGLDEVDVGWSGNKEIGMQYRFPAPRSIVKGGRRKERMVRANKRLVHQDSTRTLLPVPETRGTEADTPGDRGFGDEARIAQLLLESLSEAGGDVDNPNASIPVPPVQVPQMAHVQQISRWSTSTAVQSVMSASISNRSGVSTYTTCASERVPASRISMNTIASALGSRKSSEARRKSAMTASSSKC